MRSRFTRLVATFALSLAGCTTGTDPLAPLDGSLVMGDGGRRDAGSRDAGVVEVMDAGTRDGGPGSDGGRDAGTPRDAGPPVCGDGTVQAGEQCDDGNLVGLDGCSPDCMDEATCAMPIDLATAGTVEADGSITLTARTTGAADHGSATSCGGSGGRDLVISYTPASDGILYVSTDDPLTDFDTVLHVRTTCGDDMTELACDDDSGGGLRSIVRTRVTGGTPVFIFADGYDDSESGVFHLTVRLIPIRAAGAACDPTRVTDSCATGLVCAPAAGGATTCQAIDLGCGTGVAIVDLGPLVAADGTFTFSGDTSLDSNVTRGSCSSTVTDTAPETVHSLTLPYAAELSLDLTTGFDSVIYVRTACTDTATEQTCSDFTTVDYDALGPLAAGTRLFVFVDGYGSGTGTYTLTGALRRTLALGAACDTAGTTSRCGAGLVCRASGAGTAGTCVAQVCGDSRTEGTERCDDGALLPGDGCAADCSLEDQGPGGDTCAVPRTLALAPAGTGVRAAAASGTTVGAMHDLTGACGTGTVTTALDVVYTFTLTAASDVSIVVTPETGFDAVLYVRGSMGMACDVAGGEIDCADGFTTDTLALTALPPGTYYIVVDGYSGDTGAYTLSLTATAI